MGPRGVPVRAAAVAVVLVALLAAPGAIDGYPRAYAGWPAYGLTVLVLLDVPRGRRRWAAGLLLLLCTPALAYSYGVPLHHALVGAAVLTLSALVVASHLLQGGHTRPGALVEVEHGDGVRLLQRHECPVAVRTDRDVLGLKAAQHRAPGCQPNALFTRQLLEAVEGRESIRRVVI